MLTVGMKAPDFALPDQDGVIVRLGDLLGQALILFFYPKAETPGCTQEACDFRDRRVGLRASGYQIMGVSPDPPETLRTFRQQHGLDYTLLSDADESCHKRYGAFGEKQRRGQTTTGILRSTFVINEQGTLTHVVYRADPWAHVAELTAHLTYSPI